MFTPQEQRSRSKLKWKQEESGLGIVVKMSTRFDPEKIKARLYYHLEYAAEEMAKEARAGIRSSGMVPDEGGREAFRSEAMSKGLDNMASWSSEIALPKGPKASAAYAKMAAQMVVTFALPWVGIAWALSSFIFGRKKKKMAMPWNAIYAEALPYAQQTTKNEEIQRIAEEEAKIKQIRYDEIQRVSTQAAQFKLPTGVTSVSKGGALVLKPTGFTVQKRG